MIISWHCGWNMIDLSGGFYLTRGPDSLEDLLRPPHEENYRAAYQNHDDRQCRYQRPARTSDRLGRQHLI
jgi:hypothetical protein